MPPSPSSAPGIRFNDPQSALISLAARLAVVPVDPNQEPSQGRVLGKAVIADRDSPAADVSAMDGYAIRLTDLAVDGPLTVSGESVPGAPPPDPQPGSVMRVFTGAIVPREFDAVVKREETQELDGSLTLMDSARRTEAGTNIRRAGENARCGSMVLPPHTLITGATRASMANFGCRKIDLFSRVRLSLVTTGNEVGEYDDQLPMPWQLRDSNRASILTLLNAIPWIRIVRTEHSRDDQESLVGMLRSCVSDSDAIVLTGGVSMGDYDFVPAALRAIGGEVVFHGLPIRPGKPILGAATSDGKLLIGLPGNPVSALVGCQRMVIPLLRRVAGIEPWMPQRPLVYLGQPDEQKILLHWMRLVRLVDQGVAELVDSHGSGDLVSLGRSTGFIELPPGSSGIGPWPYTAWD